MGSVLSFKVGSSLPANKALYYVLTPNENSALAAASTLLTAPGVFQAFVATAIPPPDTLPSAIIGNWPTTLTLSSVASHRTSALATIGGKNWTFSLNWQRTSTHIPTTSTPTSPPTALPPIIISPQSFYENVQLIPTTQVNLVALQNDLAAFDRFKTTVVVTQAVTVPVSPWTYNVSNGSVTSTSAPSQTIHITSPEMIHRLFVNLSLTQPQINPLHIGNASNSSSSFQLNALIGVTTYVIVFYM